MLFNIAKGFLKGTVLVLGAICETINDCAAAAADARNEYNRAECSKEKTVEEITYEYWSNLSYCEQQAYFNSNTVLKYKYGDMYKYDNTELMAKSIAKIAGWENRAFDNKYYIY
jgi:hypothetical protein